jgi:DNA-directed RNA polymerase specialized sigma24 family protein
MPDESQGSVTLWIGDLKDGGDSAAQHLWERYFDRLVLLAHKKIQARHGGQAVADGEDAALDAFNSFCKRAALGQFPLLHDRDDLWRLLVVITIRKVAKQVRYEKALIRGGDREVDGFDEVIGPEPSPEFAAQVAEEYGRRLDGLGDEMLRRIAEDKMAGYDNDEIALRLGCSRSSIQRKLALIRREWSGEES